MPNGAVQRPWRNNRDTGPGAWDSFAVMLTVRESFFASGQSLQPALWHFGFRAICREKLTLKQVPNINEHALMKALAPS